MQPKTKLTKEDTLYSLLKNLNQVAPEKKLLGNQSGWYQVSQIYKMVECLSLQFAMFGVKTGGTVALHANRCPETIFALLALRKLGATILLTDPHQSPEDCLANCITPIRTDYICYQQTDNSFLLKDKDRNHTILLYQELTQFLETLPISEAKCQMEVPQDGTQAAFVIFTSGTDGKSKGVTLCDHNLIYNLLGSDPLGDYRFDDIALGALPLEHIFGLVLAAGTLVHGYAMYLPAQTDVDSLLQIIDQEGITRMNGVPSLYLAMAEKSSSYSLKTLRVGFIGGAPSTQAQFHYMEEALAMTLVPVYGMSECIGISCADHREPMENRCGNVGKIYAHNQVMIQLDNGHKAGPMEEGEIMVNGPSRMLGYWPNLLGSEEMLSTGDLGYLTEDGYLVITGRKKELIIRNGKNISPKRIEDALLSLPEVKQAAVVGLPHEKYGEAPYAMVVGIVDPLSLNTLLPKNELPAGIMCVNSLPLTPSGKPDKQNVKKVLQEWMNG